MTNYTIPDLTAITTPAPDDELEAFQNGDTSSKKATAAQVVAGGSLGNGTNSIAIGESSNAAGNGAIAFGLNTKAASEGAVGIGLGANAAAFSSIAIGYGTLASQSQAISIGNYTYSQNTNTISVGNSATASGINSIAIGAQAKAETNTGSIALGYSANASAANAIAIGNGATAAFANSVAIGNVTVGAANTIALPIGGNTGDVLTKNANGWAAAPPGQLTVNDAVSAAGTTQGTATALAVQSNTIATCAAGAGVAFRALASDPIGSVRWILNITANNCKTYPDSGSAIWSFVDGALATDAPMTVPALSAVMIMRMTATQWRQMV
jgi:hypothetical protein